MELTAAEKEANLWSGGQSPLNASYGKLMTAIRRRDQCPHPGESLMDRWSPPSSIHDLHIDQ